MQPFAVRAAAALVVAPCAGVLALILGLTGYTINDDVIDLHIRVGIIVIGKHHMDIAAQVGGGAVIHHEGAQCPGLHVRAADTQGNGLHTCRAAGTHIDAVITNANGAGGGVRRDVGR